jgi:anthranilate phosphoribosyltransferase
MIGELKNDEVREFDIRPEAFGLAVHPLEAIQVDGPEESKAMVLAALENKAGAARDIVALNAGAGIYVAGCAESHAAGVARALEAMASGAAREKLDRFVAFTKRQG